MVIQYLAGGFGNQIQQYVFARYVERRSHRPFIFDDTNIHAYGFFNGYELEKVFGVHPKLLSQSIDPDVSEELASLIKKNILMPQILFDAGFPTVTVSAQALPGIFRGTSIIMDSKDPGIWNLPFHNIYYYGHWTEDYWYAQDQEENRRELVFPPLTDRKNLKYAEQINGCRSVGIHIRRGDFVNAGRFLSENLYRQACEKAVELLPDACFFVFSDELDWCRANAEELGINLAGHTVYVERNVGDKSYIDMQLMSICSGLVHDKTSTFSQVAGWLNRNLELEIKIMKCEENASGPFEIVTPS